MHWDGRSLKRLKDVHEECRWQTHELEIVVVSLVCNPFRDRVPPKLYDDVIIDKLASLKLLRWWFFPFNNTVCHRLERVPIFDREKESLFIVDPSVEKCVDPYGMLIIRDFGMDGYPFTRRKLIDKEFQRKKGLRLDSLLTWEAVHATLDPECKMDKPVATLKD
ncbi:unnamed protein product [Cuscuta campestris]|uniref:Uncharacterized protein n=1 Tax=Cuscuta campestris TaxID=132261 RepID=A0A484MI61_9ASTE|nr:unnamed protein product [Cuscuta campestris]